MGAKPGEYGPLHHRYITVTSPLAKPGEYGGESTQLRLCRSSRRGLLFTVAAACCLQREVAAAGAASQRQTVWQRTGVRRGESELDISRRVRAEQLTEVCADKSHRPTHAVCVLGPLKPLEAPPRQPLGPLADAETARVGCSPDLR